MSAATDHPRPPVAAYYALADALEAIADAAPDPELTRPVPVCFAGPDGHTVVVWTAAVTALHAEMRERGCEYAGGDRLAFAAWQARCPDDIGGFSW